MAITNPTPKQVRNGNNTGAEGSGATMAKPGPDATSMIRGAKNSAEGKANARAAVAYSNVPDVTSNVQAWDGMVGGG